jgi:hypothetical protein
MNNGDYKKKLLQKQIMNIHCFSRLNSIIITDPNKVFSLVVTHDMNVLVKVHRKKFCCPADDVLGIDSNILHTGNEVLVTINVYLYEDYNLVKSVTLENSKQDY